MRLWILKRADQSGYDVKDGAVVRAETADSARLLVASKAWDEGESVWLSPQDSTCDELLVDGEAAVILEDNHPG